MTTEKTRAQQRADDLDISPTALLAEIEELKQRLQAAEQEAGETRTSWQRTAADYANFRRRTEQEREETLGLASESLLRKLLVIVDDFDRALASMPQDLAKLSWVDGLWLLERKLISLLESEGVTRIEAAGKPFDPHEHEAVTTVPTEDAPDDTVMTELQRGYRIRDRILRPALVTVAKNTGPAAGSGGND